MTANSQRQSSDPRTVYTELATIVRSYTDSEQRTFGVLVKLYREDCIFQTNLVLSIGSQSKGGV